MFDVWIFSAGAGFGKRVAVLDYVSPSAQGLFRDNINCGVWLKGELHWRVQTSNHAHFSKQPHFLNLLLFPWTDSGRVIPLRDSPR